VLLGWIALLGVGTAEAGKNDAAQRGFDLVKGETTWDFSYRWRDGGDGAQQVAFSLPASAMAADQDEVTWLQRRELNEEVAKAIRQWGKGQGDVTITAKVEKGGIQIGASGPAGDARSALKEAAEVRDRATDEWLAANDFFRMEGGDISFDHAALVSEYADELAPVAKALREGTTSDRAFVERALSFVQSIPYEARKKNGGDPGYRRPLALLSRNRGDCDSKAVLFLGIVKAELPRVPLAVVYVPGHALTGVGLEADGDDREFKVDGQRFVYAEPVGPALFPLGEPAKENKNAWKKGEVQIVE
jgi:hypothetical protein